MVRGNPIGTAPSRSDTLLGANTLTHAADSVAEDGASLQKPVSALLAAGIRPLVRRILLGLSANEVAQIAGPQYPCQLQPCMVEARLHCFLANP